MSHWEKLLNAVTERASSVLSAVVEAIRTVFESDPETRRQVALFGVGHRAVSQDGQGRWHRLGGRVNAFRQIFHFPADQTRNVARLYNLARQDVAGFEAYAQRLAGLCISCACHNRVLEDVIDGLFHIAKADGLIHEKEMSFLARVAEIFGIVEERFENIASRHVHLQGRDPYAVLGVSRSDDFAAIRKHYRSLVSPHHSDILIARGLPKELQSLANDRMAAFNAAYAAIEKERRAA